MNENTPSTIENLAKEFDSIMGSSNKSTAREEKRDSFKSSFEKLSNDNQDVAEKYKGLAKNAIKAERELKKNINETSDTAAVTHAEIMKAHENSTHEEKLLLDYKLVTKAFETKGNAKKLGDGSVELVLDHLTEMDPHDYVQNREFAKNIVVGEPNIFYKPLKEKGWFGQEKDTNEVEVVIVMNNSKRTSENTVVTMVVEHKGGKLIWGDKNDGLYNVKSLDTFVDEVTNASKYSATAEEKLSGGELTIEAYHKLFAKQDTKGRSIDKFWADHDSKIKEAQIFSDNDPHAGEKAEEIKNIGKQKSEVLAKLGEDYTEQLEKLHSHQERILGEMKKAINEIKTRNEMIIKDTLFAHIKLLQREDPRKNKKTIAVLKRELADKHKVDTITLESLIG